MRRITLICCVLFPLVGGQLLFGQVGQTGFSFLKLGVGGRALGMGEASVAGAGDPSAVYYNPASLSSAASSQILLMHKEWIQGTRTDFVGGLTRSGDATLALSLNSTTVDDIEVRTTPGPPLSTFTARNAAIGLSAAYKFAENVSLGLTTKFLYEKILIDESSGLAFDLGGLYSVSPDVRLGAAISNLGSVNELHDEAAKLPVTIRVGGSYTANLPSVEGKVTGAADVVSVTAENKSHLHMGGEFAFRNVLAVRLGYQTGYDSRNFSAGIGIMYGLFRFDYAYVPFQYDLGTTHTFSVGILFD